MAHIHRKTISGQDVKILTVARLEYVKGVDILLEACRYLMDHNFNFGLSIIGDGSQRTVLEKQMMRLRLDSHVKFFGALPHEIVIEHYSRADIFVLSSRREGIPVSVMEAMATGLPVVAPDVTGLPELIDNGQTGLLVHPADPVAFADAIIELASNPKIYQHFSRMSRAKIEEEFNIKRSVEQLVQLWGYSSQVR